MEYSLKKGIQMIIQVISDTKTDADTDAGYMLILGVDRVI